MERYPGTDPYPENDRYPGYHINDKDGYSPVRDSSFNRYNYNPDSYYGNGKRYLSLRPGDRGPYPYHDYLNEIYSGRPRFSYEYPPPIIRRYPLKEGYTGRDSSPGNDNIFPDKRFRPSSFMNRHPFLDITHSARRPEPESSKIFPKGTNSRYPTQNGVPIGNRYGGRPGKILIKLKYIQTKLI